MWQALADAVAANGTLLELDMAGNQGEAAIQSVRVFHFPLITRRSSVTPLTTYYRSDRRDIGAKQATVKKKKKN